MEAQINGNEVFYATNGHGRPMLLMHGGSGLDHTYFRPWLDTLSEQAQLIYYDQLGQGRSTRPQSYDTIRMGTWADEADALRAAPALDYPDVVMDNAQSRGTPEQVQAVIAGLSAPIADDASWQQLWTTILPLHFNRYDPEVGRKMDEATQYSARGFNQGMGVCLPAFHVLSRLSEITVPTLVMTGRHDWITPPAQGAERLHAGLPNSKLVIFEESGHFPFIEEHDKYVTTIRDWIGSLG